MGEGGFDDTRCDRDRLALDGQLGAPSEGEGEGEGDGEGDGEGR